MAPTSQNMANHSDSNSNSNSNLKPNPNPLYKNKVEYITSSPIMRQFIEQLHLVARFPLDVLIYGQTGSGKDYFARYLHYTSNREGKFIAINCAAIPESLAEAELFGVEAGAYTGAQKRMGKIEAADQGTLYLDEIDSMPLNMQAKLLRALQERGAERIGSNRFIASNFCLIASSKMDLTQAVARGQFREDLYHRLSTAPLVLPQLSQRLEDILPLFQSQAESFALDFKVDMPEITPHIQCQLLGYDWPGNVRELIACTQRFVIGLPLFIEALNLEIPKHTLKPNIRDQELTKTMAAMADEDSPIHFISLSTKKVQILNSENHPNHQNNQKPNTLFPHTQANMERFETALSYQKGDINHEENEMLLKKMIHDFEKEIIHATFTHFKHSLKKSAAFLGLPMSTLHQKIKNYQNKNAS